jgi:hypothetical protein
MATKPHGEQEVPETRDRSAVAVELGVVVETDSFQQ